MTNNNDKLLKYYNVDSPLKKVSAQTMELLKEQFATNKFFCNALSGRIDLLRNEISTLLSDYKSTMAKYQQLVTDMRQRKVHHRGADLHDWSHEEFTGLSAHCEEAMSEILGQEKFFEFISVAKEIVQHEHAELTTLFGTIGELYAKLEACDIDYRLADVNSKTIYRLANEISITETKVDLNENYATNELLIEMEAKAVEFMQLAETLETFAGYIPQREPLYRDYLQQCTNLNGLFYIFLFEYNEWNVKIDTLSTKFSEHYFGYQLLFAKFKDLTSVYMQCIPAYDYLLDVEVPRRLTVDKQLQKLITDFESAVQKISVEDEYHRKVFEEKYLKFLPQRILTGIKEPLQNFHVAPSNQVVSHVSLCPRGFLQRYNAITGLGSLYEYTSSDPTSGSQCSSPIPVRVSSNNNNTNGGNAPTSSVSATNSYGSLHYMNSPHLLSATPSPTSGHHSLASSFGISDSSDI